MNNIIMMPIKDIKPYENNPRNNKEAVDKVVASLREFGFQQPIVVDKDNVVIAGHTRLKAAKKLKMKNVPVVVAEELTEEQVKAYRLADNKTAEFAEWDLELLSEELEGIAEIDMSEFGFSIDMDMDESQEVEEDEVPEEVETRCKLGDVWQLGNHRVICGDSTDIAVIDRLMDGVKADMVFTDPPYGMKKESKGVLNDNLNFDDLLDFNRQWIPLTFGALKDNGSWYCWGIDEPLMDIYSNILKPMQKENKITFRNLITWNKSYLDNGNTFNPFGASGSKDLRMYPVADEKCLFVMCGVQGFNTNSENYFEKWEPIRKYLADECKKCGGSKIWKKMLKNDMGKHYFTKSQWLFPTKENYEKMQAFGKEYGAFGKEYEEIKKEYEEIKKEWYETRAYFENADHSNNVWNIEITKGKEKQEAGGHATPKPIALCSRAIKSSSREGEIVLDVFGGSGSTLIACEQLNRKCYMAELDPKYVSVILQRWENLTGQQAVLIEE